VGELRFRSWCWRRPRYPRLSDFPVRLSETGSRGSHGGKPGPPEALPRTVGPEDSLSLAVRANLADFLNAQGQPAEAEAEHRAILKLREHVLGPEHPKTLRSRKQRADALQAQSKYGEAETHLRAVLQIQHKEFPADHAELLGTLFNLAHCLSKQPPLPDQIGLRTTKDDRFQEAREFASRATGGAHKFLGIANDITRQCLKHYDRFVQQKETDKTGELNEKILNSIGARPGTIIVK
jgi:tetratricopeptide (TPR) repeat protein